MQQIDLTGYTIFVGSIFKELAAFLKEKSYASTIVLVDKNTQQHCLPILAKNVDILSFERICVPAGETYKNIETCQYIWKEMMDKGIGRRALCINLGGGVIGDMGGFCASTYKRGIDFIQIPTTLLSQVDASIGGKLGIDFNQIKNSIGVFANPKAVFIDPIFYQTLPRAEIRSGFAEIIKHSLIEDSKQWEKIKQITSLDTVNWTDFLIPSLKIKKQIVAIDPFEVGLRKALNFGHTIGHALESQRLQSPQPLLHGEAVAIGMICESYIAHHTVGLAWKQLEEITNFLINIYGKENFSPTSYPQLVRLMQKDKKNEKDEINFTLLKYPGKALVNQTCEEALIIESLDYYQNIKVPTIV